MLAKHIGLVARLLYHIQALEDDFGFLPPKPAQNTSKHFNIDSISDLNGREKRT
jgi:hypothetical protein